MNLTRPYIALLPTTARGFSLVELSIVLVILGLLVGGVLAGQSLIRGAELRGVLTEREKILTAVRSFRDKYFELPGDFTKATQFWGLQYSGPGCVTNSGASLAGLDSGVCDGNGNGIIDACTAADPDTGLYENLQFWWHLKKAGLIEGTVVGYNGPAQDYVSRYANGALRTAWSVRHSSSTHRSANLITAVSGQHYLTLGGEWGNCASTMREAFPPGDAYYFDTKIDDSKATSGTIQSIVAWATPNCYSGTDYLLTETAARCVLIFYNPF